MKHLNEDQLILYYYGESPSPETDRLHLEDCETCRTQLAELEQVLAEVVEEPVPERPADYEQRVWRRVEAELTNPKPRWSWLDLFRPRNLVWAAAAASILVAIKNLLQTELWRLLYHRLARNANKPQLESAFHLGGKLRWKQA